MFLILFLFFLRESAAIIYSLNETDYNLMPPLYAMDDFDSCLANPGGTYCLVDVGLFSAEHSALMNMIQQYSAHTMKHFNHTQVHRGVCITHTCKEFIYNRRLNKTEGLRHTLEECLNSSLWQSFALQGRLENVMYCKREDEREMFDTSDIIMASVLFFLIAINVIGSLYDLIFCNMDEKPGNLYLLSFSIRRNWAKLTASAGTGSRDPRLERLKVFHGLRTVTIICVFFSHLVLIMSYLYVANPHYIEKSYEDPLKQLLYNGNLVTHTFFVMSAFLLSFNLQIHAETKPVSWTHLPLGILTRWLRLVPTYALALGFTATLFRHSGRGALWGPAALAEAEACRSYWWAHLLFINNYIYDDYMCAPQTWYLAADTQLFCLGLLVLVCFRTERTRSWALSIWFTISLVIPGLQTYLQNLSAVVIQTPESYRSLYAHSAEFRLRYIRAHTNMSSTVIGLAGGLLAYKGLSGDFDAQRFKKYRWVVWTIFPLGVLVILSGGLFYADGSPPPDALRVIYSMLYKPIFQTLVVAFILGCIFRMETLCRGIVEWRGWAWCGRTSFSAFLAHTHLQRAWIGQATTPIYMADYSIMMMLCATIFLSFAVASVLWLCVEAPFGTLVKLSMEKRKK